MKTFLATTALSIAMTAPVFAEQSASESPFMSGEASAELRASNLIGMNLYTTEGDLDSYEAAEADQNWENIGEISDVILSRDGKVMAVLLDIGGFLGIGERTVAVDMRDLNLVSDSDNEGDFFVVVNAKKAQLEEAPEYDTAGIGNWYERDGAEAGRAISRTSDSGMENAEQAQDEIKQAANMSQDAAEETAESAEMEAETEAEASAEAEQATEETAQEVEEAAEDTAQAAENAAEETAEAVEETAEDVGQSAEETAEAATNADTGAEASAEAQAEAQTEEEAFAMVDATKLSPEELDGTRVYDSSNEWIGEISEVLTSGDGKVETVVVDVGGFLGIGEKPVGLSVDKIEVLRNDSGGQLKVNVKASKEELEAMDEYQG